MVVSMVVAFVRSGMMRVSGCCERRQEKGWAGREGPCIKGLGPWLEKGRRERRRTRRRRQRQEKESDAS